MDVKQQQKLKAQAHSLKPVVLMGEKRPNRKCNLRD